MKQFSEMSKRNKILLGFVIVVVIGFLGDAMGWWEMTSMISGTGDDEV